MRLQNRRFGLALLLVAISLVVGASTFAPAYGRVPVRGDDSTAAICEGPDFKSDAKDLDFIAGLSEIDSVESLDDLDVPNLTEELDTLLAAIRERLPATERESLSDEEILAALLPVNASAIAALERTSAACACHVNSADDGCNTFSEDCAAQYQSVVRRILSLGLGATGLLNPGCVADRIIDRHLTARARCRADDIVTNIGRRPGIEGVPLVFTGMAEITWLGLRDTGFTSFMSAVDRCHTVWEMIGFGAVWTAWFGASYAVGGANLYAVMAVISTVNAESIYRDARAYEQAVSAGLCEPSLQAFTDRASWQTAAGGNAGDISDNLNSGSQAGVPGTDPFVRIIDRGSFTISGTAQNAFPNTNRTTSVDGTGYLRTLLGTQPTPGASWTQFTFEQPVSAVGFDVNPWCSGGNCASTNSLGATVYVAIDGAPEGVYALPSTDRTEFRGFVSTEPFTKFRVSHPSGGNASHGIDNVEVFTDASVSKASLADAAGPESGG